jgi:inosine/xanthosine triphosphatase
VIVLVGSTRPAKVEGAREALAAIARIDPRFHSAHLVPHDLTELAPRQPMSTADIVDGARIRASALIERHPSAGERFALGLEGGLEHLPAPVDRWVLQSWAAVTDGVTWSYGAGPALMIPPPVIERVLLGEEMGDVIDRLAGRSVRGGQGAWGILTRDLIGRRDAFRLAVIAAFAPFYQ